jgi:hypothetical protein
MPQALHARAQRAAYRGLKYYVGKTTWHFAAPLADRWGRNGWL